MDLVFAVARPTFGSDELVLRTRMVSRRYPGVPRQGDMVDLDDCGHYAAPVDSILWDADGSVMLIFTDVTEVSESDLDDWGFAPGDLDQTDETDTPDADFASLSDLDTTFRATPPQELENLRSVLEYLAPPTLGEIIDELGKYDRATPVELPLGDDDLDDDAYDKYPSGHDGEGTEFIDLQAVWLRATDTRPVEEPSSSCILCGADITMGRYGPRGESVWIHKASGVSECQEDTAPDDR